MNPTNRWWLLLLGLAWWAQAPAAPDEMPQGLGQALHEARHAIEAEGDSLVAINHRNDQRIRFEGEGIEVTPTAEDADWRWGMTLTGYGTPGDIQPVQNAERQVEGTRLEYRRGPITEWYVNKSVGLEQGFTLSQPPVPDANELVLALALEGGLTPEWEQPGQALRFHAPSGYALSYRELKVIDAKGVELPARLALDGASLEIRVDARGAAWPVVVDPLVFDEQNASRVWLLSSPCLMSLGARLLRSIMLEPSIRPA